MNTDDRFLNEIFRIVSGALRLDIDKVRNYTAFLADKMEQAGDRTSATRLRKMLSETDHTLRPAGLSSARSLPVDSESRFPLVEKVNLRHVEDAPVILDPARWATVAEFLSVAKSYAQLEAEGVSTPLSLMLFGAPGVGKSRLARHVARELGLDLYIARLDGLISSFLGSTSKNIRALFEFAARTPCVLFLDEFDAIAKLRGDTQELGELKRVVNSFLQNLDALGPQTIVVAATNHEELLDRAVWRRFSYRLHLDYPSLTERAAMWLAFLRTLRFSPREVALLADVSEGFSGSDIQEAANRLHRQRVTTKKEPEVSAAFRALQSLSTGDSESARRFLGKVANSPLDVTARALRDRDPRLYSHAAIARLLGVSKTTAFRLTSSETKSHD
ncbi:MAG: ATP-binding protein [Gemmatimonadetes bacterium]|nr:ATP-binding protein [Gemmatimonadota bacterium]